MPSGQTATMASSGAAFGGSLKYWHGSLSINAPIGALMALLSSASKQKKTGQHCQHLQCGCHWACLPKASAQPNSSSSRRLGQPL
jgi:hypothetical protein